MSGVSHLEPKFRGMRRNQQVTVKVEEKRLQRLLDFIDTRMADQRSKLKRQIADTQHTAEEMEEQRHRATLQLLKNYFEVTSGRVKPGNNSNSNNSIHEERMLGVLSEPSLATVPEVDPEILSKPRSMYDRITRTLDTSRLPLIAPHNRNLVTQSRSLPASVPHSNRSDEDSSVPSTPRNTSSPLDPAGDDPPARDPHGRDPHGRDLSGRDAHGRDAHGRDALGRDLPTRDPHEKDARKHTASSRRELFMDKLNHQKVHRKDSESFHNNRISTHTHAPHINGLSRHNGQYDTLNGHEYQKGQLKPTSRLNVALEEETLTPRLGDVVASKNGLSRHSSLRRPSMGTSTAMSTMSLSELQLTRKQKAASKLKHALKNVRGPR